ncbi:MAG: undecaprenyldiphospho-muramoylpentapeptide beta-N-acetylglucosaminyltransferase [Rhodospirillales bacterium]|nr:undecaprenyldiphospho-muramoylpentapeptide beta-N-acetylglucosaminyltransferase [Rhodospirillales bacterium]
MSVQKKLIVLAAGGTAGHVFPAQALATQLKLRGWQVAFITDDRGAAIHGVEDLETFIVRAGGVAGKSIFGRIRSFIELGIGVLQARSILKRLEPDIVMGFGGYASVPTMLAARWLKCTTAIHEQNAILGRANRLLASGVSQIATSYNESKFIPLEAQSKVVVTGMPVREEVLGCNEVPYLSVEVDAPLSLIIVGGSLGARVLSEVVPVAIGMLSADIRSRLKIVQQCRSEDIEQVRDAYKSMGLEAELDTFIRGVPQRISQSHLLIARAGSSTVAECMAVGRPAILVPYPHAVDDHQSANAHAVASAGAGWIMDQSVFTAENLAARLGELFGVEGILKSAAKCACKVGVSNAASRLADMAERLTSTEGEKA